jgi:predicted ester cyclase
MSTDIESNKGKARRIWEEIFPQGDVDGLAEVIHPDSFDHTDPSGPQGFEAVKNTMLWLNGVFSDQVWDIHQVIGEGDTVVVHGTLTAMHTGDLMGIPPTGRQIRQPYVQILRFEDGKAIERWGVRDDATLMRQLGVMPPPKQAAEV